MMKYKLYEVGGRIRDEFLGLQSKDIDYTVVLEDLSMDPLVAFDEFCKTIESEGFKIFHPKPEHLTVRAKFPKDHIHSGDADFVLSRIEVGYEPGTRKPIVQLASLEDDLRRRDFTVNAMCKDIDGNVIDLFNGMNDLKYKLLRTPIDPKISFSDDPLRIIRGIRFCIMKEGFTMSTDCIDAIKQIGLSGIEVVSKERIQGEMNRCFKFDSKKTLEWLFKFENEFGFPLLSYIFDGTGLWLNLTDKKNGK